MIEMLVQCEKPYSIHFLENIFTSPELKNKLHSFSQKKIIIADSKVAQLYGINLQNILNCELISFPHGEQNKTRETKQQIENELFKKKLGRDTLIIALGGGVTTDISGFIAATYCRGVPCIYIPTTLLAMVDASIGGKTGINTPFGKNTVGTFTQPNAVFIDSYFLETLSEPEFMSGFIELLKHSLIYDKALYLELKKNINSIKSKNYSYLNEIIYKSCLIKKQIVEQDETESSLRAILNFGHNIAHAIETIENYSMPHGTAVAIGMIVESYLSTRLNLLSNQEFEDIKQFIESTGLNLTTNAFNHKNQFISLLQQDKKTKNNDCHFILLQSIGQVFTNNSNQYTHIVKSDILNETLDWAQDYFSCL